MADLDSIDAFAQRIHCLAEKVVTGLRTLRGLIVAQEGLYPVRITQDDPNSIAVDILAPDGYEAGLDLTIGNDLKLYVSVIVDGKNRDKRVIHVREGDAITAGFRKVMAYLELHTRK